MVRQWEKVRVCVIGDFNSILVEGERVGVGGDGIARERRMFQDFLEKSNLFDVSLQGRRFTWYRSNGNCESRLDRALVNERWVETWGSTALRGLPRWFQTIVR